MRINYLHFNFDVNEIEIIQNLRLFITARSIININLKYFRFFFIVNTRWNRLRFSIGLGFWLLDGPIRGDEILREVNESCFDSNGSPASESIATNYLDFAEEVNLTQKQKHCEAFHMRITFEHSDNINWINKPAMSIYLTEYCEFIRDYGWYWSKTDMAYESITISHNRKQTITFQPCVGIHPPRDKQQYTAHQKAESMVSPNRKWHSYGNLLVEFTFRQKSWKRTAIVKLNIRRQCECHCEYSLDSYQFREITTQKSAGETL